MRECRRLKKWGRSYDLGMMGTERREQQVTPREKQMGVTPEKWDKK